MTVLHHIPPRPRGKSPRDRPPSAAHGQNLNAGAHFSAALPLR